MQWTPYAFRGSEWFGLPFSILAETSGIFERETSTFGYLEVQDRAEHAPCIPGLSPTLSLGIPLCVCSGPL